MLIRKISCKQIKIRSKINYKYKPTLLLSKADQ